MQHINAEIILYIKQLNTFICEIDDYKKMEKKK